MVSMYSISIFIVLFLLFLFFYNRTHQYRCKLHVQFYINHCIKYQTHYQSRLLKTQGQSPTKHFSCCGMPASLIQASNLARAWLLNSLLTQVLHISQWPMTFAADAAATNTTITTASISVTRDWNR